MAALRAAVVTVSSSLARGEGEDRSGPRLVELCRAAGLEVSHETVSDDRLRAPERMSAIPPRSDKAPRTMQEATNHQAPASRAASCASTLTFRLPSAFITTAVHRPFVTGQLIVCVPVPLARVCQKLCADGGDFGAPIPSRR